MLIRNRIAGALLLGAVISAPAAMADGRDRVPVAGPSPLTPHAAQPCPHGELTGGACIQPRVKPPKDQATVEKVVRVVEQAPVYDFSGFNGGVGVTIASGPFYAGGGTVIIRHGKRFSGVRGHRAFSGVRFSGGRIGGGCAG